jgi:hypothetical protein
VSQLVIVACWTLMSGYFIDAPTPREECWRIELFESPFFEDKQACSEHLEWWKQRPWMKKQIATLSMLNQSAPDRFYGRCFDGEHWT